MDIKSRMTRLVGTSTHQLRQLEQFSDAAEIWQHTGTQVNYVGDARAEDDEFVLVATVAEYSQELRELVGVR